MSPEPAEIEVGVVGEIDDGGLVRGGAVLELELVPGEGVADVGGESAGEAHVAVGRDEGELDA